MTLISRTCDNIRTLFTVELVKPTYAESDPYIVAEYRRKVGERRLDIANARQRLPAGLVVAVLLLTLGPDRFYCWMSPTRTFTSSFRKRCTDVLRRLASERQAQLLIATHSEVLLDATSPERVISFVKTKPRRLAHKSERDALREAMKRLTTTEILMAEETGSIIYLEDHSDERILSAWADVLEHPARAFLDRPFVHALRGSSLKEANDHFFAFCSVIEPVAGLVILDGDNRPGGDEDAGRDGLRVVRWRRYEIENYLLVPRAIAAVSRWGDGGLVQDAVESVFHKQVPRGADLFDDDIAGLTNLKASDQFLPQLLEAAGRDLPKRDFFLIAAQMQPNEIHPEVVEKLDLIAATLGDGTRR